MYFGFRGELGFLNCDDVCMCVVNKQYNEIYLTFTASSVCLCGVSSSWSVCEVVVVAYVVSAVVAVTVMRVLLFVLHVCVL